jgi:hypothetical protein
MDKLGCVMRCGGFRFGCDFDRLFVHDIGTSFFVVSSRHDVQQVF